MDRIKKTFQNLQWKLTISYTLVTVAALLVVQIVVVVIVWVIIANSNIYPRALVAIVRDELVPQIVKYIDMPEPDINGLTGWLRAAESSAGLTFQSLNFPVAQVSLSDFDENTTLLVLDENLKFLVGIPASTIENYGTILDQADQAIQAAQAGEEDPGKISQITPNQALTVAVPVRDESHNLLGMVILRTVYPPRGILIGLLSYIGGSLIFFTIAAGLLGSVFGYITARGLTRRFRRVTETTDMWSRGDFSNFIDERSMDEIGQLAQRLNVMAEQLQNLIRTRQELAGMEERNRLARDLHDSIKQQVFATVMQLGAARELIEKDAQSARKHLDEAEALARQSQSELTTIIRELRPATLGNLDLVSALRKEISRWSKLSTIPVDASFPDDCDLPEEKEMVLFRISQEALSNITRHSQATLITIELTCNYEEISLEISDNGKGFDAESRDHRGVGLRSMKERIDDIGGNFQVESVPGQGTTVKASIRLANGGSR